MCDNENIGLAFRASNLSRSVSVESTHRRLHEKVSSLLGKKGPSHWHEVAWKAAMSINCQPNESIGYSPYYLFYGKHPIMLGSAEVPTNVDFDSHWLYDLKIAKSRCDSTRLQKSADYTYPVFEKGQTVYVRPDNSKNAVSLQGDIFEDNGGATLVVKLDNRSRPIPVHKGMVFVKKYSEAWKLLNATNRDFHEMANKSVRFVDDEIRVPVSANTRSKTRVIS